jgi:hypothetical protein
MLTEIKNYINADEILKSEQIGDVISEELFNKLICDFKTSYLQSINYDEQIELHTKPNVLRNGVLSELYKYHSQIQGRKEIHYNYPEEGCNEYANSRIAWIMEADKRITSPYIAMQEYCKLRSKNLKTIAVHYTELLAVEQLIQEIRISIVDEPSHQEPSQSLNKHTEIAYREVLKQIILFGTGLEKMAGSISKHDEEGYRAAFIAHLRTVSKHIVHAEAYNGNGKTDILVTDSGGNTILIAECKLWNGEANLAKAIDQLLENYITWRDNKAALIIFNRDVKNFSEVMTKAVKILFNHQLCSTEMMKSGEAAYSFLFRHPDDATRTTKLELVLFNFA